MKPIEFQICSTCVHWDLKIDADGHATNLDQDIPCLLHGKVMDCNDTCKDWKGID